MKLSNNFNYISRFTFILILATVAYSIYYIPILFSPFKINPFNYYSQSEIVFFILGTDNFSILLYLAILFALMSKWLIKLELTSKSIELIIFSIATCFITNIIAIRIPFQYDKLIFPIILNILFIIGFIFLFFLFLPNTKNKWFKYFRGFRRRTFTSGSVISLILLLIILFLPYLNIYCKYKYPKYTSINFKNDSLNKVYNNKKIIIYERNEKYTFILCTDSLEIYQNQDILAIKVENRN